MFARRRWWMSSHPDLTVAKRYLFFIFYIFVLVHETYIIILSTYTGTPVTRWLEQNDIFRSLHQNKGRYSQINTNNICCRLLIFIDRKQSDSTPVFPIHICILNHSDIEVSTKKLPSPPIVEDNLPQNEFFFREINPTRHCVSSRNYVRCLIFVVSNTLFWITDSKNLCLGPVFPETRSRHETTFVSTKLLIFSHNRRDNNKLCHYIIHCYLYFIYLQVSIKKIRKKRQQLLRVLNSLFVK